jgi:transcriptional regulator with XRE-family HTH domain
LSISEELSRLRTLKGVSLREVEKATGVSNAYLSQLENKKTDKPSPHILHKLAKYYDVEYTHLLKIAGYLEEKKEKSSSISLNEVQSALMGANLSDSQKQLVVKFIEMLGSQEKD